MKNLNLFKSNVSGMDREWIENGSGLTRHHGKLWKHVAMIVAVLVLSVANVGTAWGTEVSATQFATSQSGTTFTVTAKSGHGSLAGVTVTTVGSGGGQSSGRLKVPVGTFNFSVASGYVITSIEVSWLDNTNNYPASNSELTANAGSVSTNTSTKKSSWTGSAQSISLTNASSSKTFQVVGLTINYSSASSTYYYRGEDNSWGSTAMTASAGGTYEYKASSRNGHQFKIATSSDSWDYNYSYVDAGFYGTSSDIGDYSSNNCYVWISGSYYIVVFKPNTAINTTNNPKICASATLPQDQFTISFNKGSGSGTMSSITSINAGSDQAVTANSFTAPSGYQFAGWKANVNVKVGGSTKTAGTVLADGVTIQSVLSDITLTAQWELIPTYDVIYNTNGGTGGSTATQSGNADGSQVTTSANGFTKTGYKFKWWNTAANGSGEDFYPGEKVTIDGADVNLYAQWEQVSSGWAFWVGDDVSSSPADIAGNGVTMRITNSADYNTDLSAATTVVSKYNSSVDKRAKVLACGSNDSKYFQIHFTDGSPINSLKLGVAGKDGAYDMIVIYSTTADFSSGEGEKVVATTYAATQSTKQVKDFSPSVANKYFYARVYRNVTTAIYGLTGGSAHTIRVYSIKAQKGVSCSTPAAPTNFTAGSISATGATFTITDAADAASYDIYYSTESTAPTSGTAATTTSTSKTKEVTGLTAGTTYYAWVRSVCDASHKSAWVALNPGGDTHTFATSCVAPTTVDISATVNEVSGYWFYPDDDVVLTATPTGSPAGSPVTYQWKKNGSNVGTNSATLTINDAAASDAGKYTCTISYGACSTTSAEFELKCMQFYLKNSGGGDISNHALQKVDATHATLALSLTGGTTYKFRVTDGCNNWYGNSDATGMTSSNCSNWTMPHDADCKVTTSSKSATYTFNFDFSAGLLGSEMKVSVVYPSGDQPAGKIIYWDNSVLNWASAPWYRIGKGTHNNKTQMTLVPGTANLYKITTTEYNGFEYWHIANNDGNGTGNIFWTKGEEEHAITNAMGFEGSPVTADAITVTPTAGSHGTGTSSDNDNCEFYEYGQQNGMKTDRVTISDYSNGTITVNYTNTSNVASTLTSGYADLAHTVKLTSITATPNTGYDASAITINDGDYSANYVVTGATTIAATFSPHVYTITYKDQGNVAFSGTHTDTPSAHPTSHTYNTTTNLNGATKAGYTFDGWYTSPDCLTGLVTSLGATDYTADITLYAKWTVAASLTAISADVLYQAADMANITFTGSDQYWAGLSTNNLFQTYGDGTSNSAKGKTISSTNVTDDISTKSFTSHAYIEGSDVTSGTADPTYGAIEFITPSTAGILYVYTVDGSSSNLKLRKKGSSTFTALTGSSNYNAIAVDANSNYYIHGNASKRGLYGIQYVSTYAVTITPTNVTKEGATGAGAAIYGKAYTATFTANTGYALPDDATVTIGGVEQTKGTGYTWTISAGTATLTVLAAKVTGAISIAVSGVALPTHTVSYNGNGSTSGDAPTDANAYVEGADVTVLGKNTLVKTNNGFAGWNTVSNGSGTWRVQGETFSMGAADVALHAQWVPTANLTVGTLYTVGDMKAKAIGSSTGYRPGYSSNGIFELLGVGTADDNTLKNSPMEYNTDSRTIDGTEFTHALNFKGQGAGSPSGTTLPTARAIKFHVGESGTLHLWVRAGSKINIVKDGGSASAVGSSTDRTHETVEVTAGTWYLYATGSSTSLYGMKLMTCTNPELAYGTTAVAKNYGDDAFTNPLTKAAGASPAFSSDNPSVATVNISTGEVTIVGVGSATITASISDDATYCDDEASYTLTVYPSYTVTYNAMGGTCGTENAVTELGKVTLPSATHGTYTTYTWVTYDGAFVGYEGEEYEPAGNITLYAKWQGDCAAGGGSDGVLFSAEFKDSGLGTSNICTAANDPVTFTTDQLKDEPIGGSISAYTTNTLSHMQYVANGICIHGTDGVIKITLDAAINTNDLFEYVNVHSSNPNAYLRHTSASNTTDQIVLTAYNSKNVKVMLPAAFNGKKELYIVKQSTDFKLHKAAVVRPAFLMLLRDDTPTANTTNLSGTDEALTTENYLEVIRGGSASYTSPTSGDLIIKRSDNKNYVQFNKSTGYLKITVSPALQEGDVIGFDSYNTNDLALTTTAEYSKSIHTTSQLYTVGSSSPLKDQTTFYIWQYSGSSDYLRGLQIARSAVVGSSCYAVIYEGNGADGGYTNDPKAYDNEHNDVVVLPNGYTRTGYEFVGWNTAADGSGTPYAPLETISDIDDDVTLYAQWRILITSDNTNFSGYASVTSADDVRVADGAMLTITSTRTIHDIIIETGSTLNVNTTNGDGTGSGVTFTVNSLHLNGGWNSSYTTYDMPRIYIDPASTLTKVVNTVNLDISVDSRNYYPIAVPFKVKVSDVDYANSTLASFSNYGANGQYVIKDYDGARRAENGPDQVNNWKVVPQKDEKNNDVYLEPGRGYIMTAISIPSYGGGVIRFPMSFTNDWTAEGEQGTVDAVTKNVVAVKAYEGAATAGDKKVNKGWNLLGVPFMSCYGTSADMGTDGVVMQGKFDFKTGEWKEEDVRYVNVPVHDFSEYIQVDMEDDDPVTVLRPGWCFFVQVEEDGDLTFLTADQAASSSLPIYAPKRGVKADMPTVKTGIILSDGEKSDKTTFLVSDKYNGAEYEINADLEKMFGNGYTLATYSLSGTTRLAYNALGNADAANIIPIGYRAPADGEYTFSINPRYAENGAFENVNLIDYETGIVTDLLKFSYTFSTERTQNDTRFALNVVKQKETPTNIELVGGDAQVDGPRKLLLDGKMYIILDGKMFDAQGKRVQ